MRIPRVMVGLCLGFLLVACNGGTDGSSGDSLEQAHLAATQAALEATQAALDASLSEAQQPTADTVSADIEAPSDEVVADEPDGPTGDAGEGNGISDAPAFYLEEFNSDGVELWTYYLLQGNEEDFAVYTNNGTLTFEVNNEQTYTYFLYDPYVYTDVVVQTSVESLVKRNYANSLVCRVSDRGWYELAISNNGLYAIWNYDAINASWNQLYNGGSEEIDTGIATNEFALVCEGDQISIYVNGSLERTVKDSFHREGQVGIGVSSLETYPIIATFDWVNIAQP